MRIDAHQHFWKYDPAAQGWITEEMKSIRKDFTPLDLHPMLTENCFDGCVTVQVDQTDQETLSLLRLAEQNKFIKGIVGWVDLMSPRIEERLSILAPYQKLKGFRHIVQGLPAGFLLQKEFLRGVRSLARFGFTYDVLVYPNQLEEAVSFVRQFQNQKFVLDHMAKPFIRNKVLEPWRKHISELAKYENVSCKLSGLVTEADWTNWKQVDFAPYLDTITNCFGPKRLLYGSDWPVCLLAASYSRQLQIVEDHINKFSSGEKNDIMGENAVTFYNL